MNDIFCSKCGEPAAFPKGKTEPWTCLQCEDVEQPVSSAAEKPKAVRSSELLGRVRELEQECEEILQILIDHGQMVAAHKMDDAVTGLHKTKYCWNDAIKW